MRKHYDFDKMKGQKNPYAKRLKKQVSIRLDATTVDYFQSLADETGIPYQTLIASVLHKFVEGQLSERK